MLQLAQALKRADEAERNRAARQTEAVRIRNQQIEQLTKGQEQLQQVNGQLQEEKRLLEQRVEQLTQDKGHLEMFRQAASEQEEHVNNILLEKDRIIDEKQAQLDAVVGKLSDKRRSQWEAAGADVNELSVMYLPDRDSLCESKSYGECGSSLQRAIRADMRDALEIVNGYVGPRLKMPPLTSAHFRGPPSADGVAADVHVVTTNPSEQGRLNDLPHTSVLNHLVDKNGKLRFYDKRLSHNETAQALFRRQALEVAWSSTICDVSNSTYRTMAQAQTLLPIGIVEGAKRELAESFHSQVLQEILTDGQGRTVGVALRPSSFVPYVLRMLFEEEVLHVNPDGPVKARLRLTGDGFEYDDKNGFVTLSFTVIEEQAERRRRGKPVRWSSVYTFAFLSGKEDYANLASLTSTWSEWNKIIEDGHVMVQLDDDSTACTRVDVEFFWSSDAKMVHLVFGLGACLTVNTISHLVWIRSA